MVFYVEGTVASSWIDMFAGLSGLYIFITLPAFWATRPIAFSLIDSLCRAAQCEALRRDQGAGPTGKPKGLHHGSPMGSGRQFTSLKACQ